ncbi:Alpha/Beta hydrolase protein [Hyaloraphidium curvatum]|nr:Alpha/Beta hydrolase protein [Hyaloraphidium curvatum]
MSGKSGALPGTSPRAGALLTEDAVSRCQLHRHGTSQARDVAGGEAEGHRRDSPAQGRAGSQHPEDQVGLLWTAPDGRSLRLCARRISREPLAGFEDGASGDIDALIFDPPNTHSGFDLPTLLYFHGGGFIDNSAESHQGLTSSFAQHGVRVVSINYRLSPENPFPAALTDAISAYKHLLLNDGVSEERIFFGGDSAGGNLAQAAAIWVRDHGSNEDIPRPAGLILISPWNDLTNSSPTRVIKEEFENDVISDSSFAPVPEYVTGKESVVADALVTPLADNKGDLPPQFWALATADRLIGENLAMVVKRIEGAGENCTVDIYEDQVHVFQFYRFLKQTEVFFERASKWIVELSENPTSPPETSVNFVSYGGAVTPIPEGSEDLKKRLKAYLDRVNGGKKRGGFKLEDEYFRVAGAVGSKAKL